MRMAAVLKSLPVVGVTLATVSADFQGRYALAGNENTVDCKSKFALEDQILAAAGAPPVK